jgi:hypothetical protein
VTQAWLGYLRSELFQTVIVQARYSGVYEGGLWLAFPNDTFPGLDSDAFGDDGDAQGFWWDPDPLIPLIGRGNTPDEALEDMVRRYKENQRP